VHLSSPVSEGGSSFQPSPQLSRRSRAFARNQHTQQATMQPNCPQASSDTTPGSPEEENIELPTIAPLSRRGRGRPRREQPTRPAAYRSQYHLVQEHHLGPMNVKCDYCAAILFQGETSSRCCGNGQFRPVPQETPPAYLRGLLVKDTELSYPQEDSALSSDPVHFRANLRFYNLAFQFTSISCNEDSGRGYRPVHSSWYQIHGQVFHLQGQLSATDETRAMWAQLYFYDPDVAARRRIENTATVSVEFKPRETIMRGLHQMMEEHNELVKVYKSAHQMLADLRQDTTGRHHVRVSLNIDLVLKEGQDQR
jgi:hypothetical protein